VTGVGNKRKRVRDEPENHLDCDEARVERDTDGEGAVEISCPVFVIVGHSNVSFDLLQPTAANLRTPLARSWERGWDIFGTPNLAKNEN